jgi:stage III sporulation protein AA
MFKEVVRMKYKQVKNVLYKELRELLEQEKIQFEYLYEIRIRVGQPVLLLYRGKEVLLPIKTSEKNLRETLERVCNYSLHAYENEIKQGYVTIEGGHRVGVAGQVSIRNFISSINIRVAHEIIGCADKLFPYVISQETVCHTLIISPPRCGKTTLLRDLIRQISDGNAWIKGSTVGVVDERSELAGCYRGIAQNKMGMRTDVLDACEKINGMLMLIRSMSPQVIAIDEIGGREEISTIQYAMRCGVKVVATIHGESFDELRKKPVVQNLWDEKYFERYIVLKNKDVGEIGEIYDGQGNLLCLNGLGVS